jgi:hypothetical protein
MWIDLECTLKALHISHLEFLVNFEPFKKVMAAVFLVCIFRLKFINGLLYLQPESSYCAEYYTAILVVTCAV